MVLARRLATDISFPNGGTMRPTNVLEQYGDLPAGWEPSGKLWYVTDGRQTGWPQLRHHMAAVFTARKFHLNYL